MKELKNSFFIILTVLAIGIIKNLGKYSDYEHFNLQCFLAATFNRYLATHGHTLNTV